MARGRHLRADRRRGPHLAPYTISVALGRLVQREVDREHARRLKHATLDDQQLVDALDRAHELHEDLAAIVPGSNAASTARPRRSTPTPDRFTLRRAMTAKQQLRERIEAFYEQEASQALRLLDLRVDPVIAAFRDAPLDDEPWTAEDEAAAAEGRADLAAGRTVSLEQAFAELDE